MTCSHYYGRANKTVRFDPENCDTLCFYCHATHEGNKHDFYREWKIRQLGVKRHDALALRSRKTGKYGAWEKAELKKILKEQYEKQEHLKRGWTVTMP